MRNNEQCVTAPHGALSQQATESVPAASRPARTAYSSVGPLPSTHHCFCWAEWGKGSPGCPVAPGQRQSPTSFLSTSDPQPHMNHRENPPTPLSPLCALVPLHLPRVRPRPWGAGPSPRGSTTCAEGSQGVRV